MIIKKSEKDERREKIIDVAFRLFVDKKIESVTMGEIAKEAGSEIVSTDSLIFDCSYFV